MDFRLSEDQEALRRGMRELLEARFGREALRQSAYAVPDSEASGGGVPGGAVHDGAVPGGAVLDGGVLGAGLWKELGEAGLFSLRLPEDAGGVGLGLPEAVLVFEEAGHALLPGPLVASHLAAGLVPGAADGSVIVTALDLEARTPIEHLPSSARVLAVGGAVRALPPDELVVRPMRSVDPLSPLHALGNQYESEEAHTSASGEPHASGTLDGARKPPGGHGAEQPPGEHGAGRPHEGYESGRPQEEGGGALLEADPVRLRREAALLTAAQQLGSASRTLAMAADHARTREQFGQPIGAFQAVKHLCAGMLVRSETARSVVYAAAVTGDESEALAAKLLADEAAVRNARDCLQVHGGMGFTWEAEVHLHLKRAWLRAEQWRTAATAEEELASAL